MSPERHRPGGRFFDRYGDGLRFLATAQALALDRRHLPAATTAACDALKCFLTILEESARREFPDPDGELGRLRAQCEALLTLRQAPVDALGHALEAARLAQAQAARVLLVLADRLH